MAEQPVDAVVTDNPAATDNPILDTFFQHWQARRGSRLMPARADIQPAAMKAHLGWLCFIEALPDFADFRFRLIGSRVAEYFLGEATGLTVREAYAAAEAGAQATENVLWILRKTCTARHPMRVTGGGGEWAGHVFPDYDALYLPLSDGGEAANMVMCGFTFNYRAFLRTRSLGVMTKR